MEPNLSISLEESNLNDVNGMVTLYVLMKDRSDREYSSSVYGEVHKQTICNPLETKFIKRTRLLALDNVAVRIGLSGFDKECFDSQNPDAVAGDFKVPSLYTPIQIKLPGVTMRLNEKLVHPWSS